MINQNILQLSGFVLLFFLIASFNNDMPENKIMNRDNNGPSVRNRNPHIVFLITKDSLNYEADKTIPAFARLLEKEMGYKTTVLLGSGIHGAYTYPNFDVIDKADLVVVFARRIALPHTQMNLLKKYLHSGKPIVGIRTANHAFTMMGENAQQGFEYWPEFVSSILGCENRGYGPVGPGVDISVNANAANLPIVKGLPLKWHSEANVYKVAPLLDSNITVLLTGRVNEIVEPVAWIRNVGPSKIFYTSLGHPSDFKTPQFVRLLLNGIEWALSK